MTRDPKAGARAAGLAACVLLALVARGVASPDLEDRIPPDDSLTSAGYVALGMPDPHEPWGLEVYVSALRVLGSIERTRLPRFESKSSRLVFDRLVVTHNAIPAVAVAGAEGSKPTSDLPTLYSPGAADHFLFDRELVAIRSSELRTIVSIAPTLDELLQEERSATGRYEKGFGDSAGLQETLESYALLRAQSAQAIQTRFEQLLVVGSIPSLRDVARQDLLAGFSAVEQGLLEKLPTSERSLAAAELRALATLPANSGIREGLRRVADTISDPAEGVK